MPFAANNLSAVLETAFLGKRTVKEGDRVIGIDDVTAGAPDVSHILFTHDLIAIRDVLFPAFIELAYFGVVSVWALWLNNFTNVL